VPFVFYHGLDEWKIPDEFLSLADAEQGWKPYLLNFRFPVLDLGRIPDRALSADYRLQARLLAMKYATRKAQQMAIQGLLIEALRRASEDLRPIIHYLIQVYCYDEQTLRHIIREVRPEEEAAMMSQCAQDIRQKALQEGIQQGVQQGIRKGRLEGEARLLLRVLPRRFGPLPTEISERVHRADPKTIETWTDRVLDAESLEDVFFGIIAGSFGLLEPSRAWDFSNLDANISRFSSIFQLSACLKNDGTSLSLWILRRPRGPCKRTPCRSLALRATRSNR